VIIPDVNLLVYAYDSKSAWHTQAAAWWSSCLSGNESIGLCWIVALGFMRLWTNPKVFENPMTIDQAIGHIESWLARPMVRIVHPGPKHAELLFAFLRAEGKGANLITDAHIAAVALEARGVIHTTDTDFWRFQGIRCLNPLHKAQHAR
jgi:toxin-antitoxin system PIN domain toxin